MITSDIVKIKKTDDNAQIENELKKIGIEPLRWAVVKVLDDELLISVSYVVQFSHIAFIFSVIYNISKWSGRVGIKRLTGGKRIKEK